MLSASADQKMFGSADPNGFHENPGYLYNRDNARDHDDKVGKTTVVSCGQKPKNNEPTAIEDWSRKILIYQNYLNLLLVKAIACGQIRMN